ncbi:NUDIX domain-containing protein [Streptomyces sp. NPDC046909]|uniref:NUDIX hydrolase n=1 Tax=Streptomyces sp. NPDC046909 TaxID=3155617 RepID=UPI0033EBE92B
MNGSQHRAIIDVHLLLVRDMNVLLTRRRGSYGDGMWHLPSGKVEKGESVETAVIREAREEVGIMVKTADLRCVHAIHVQHPGEEPRVGFFFEATQWHGEPVNREPTKCSAVEWFPLDGLPEATISYPAAGIAAYQAGVPFSVLGWGHDEPHPTSPSIMTDTPNR